MAFTQDDLTRINTAIAEGVRTVRYNDGRTVIYQDMEGLLLARDAIRAELAAAASPNPGARVFRLYQSGSGLT